MRVTDLQIQQYTQLNYFVVDIKLTHIIEIYFTVPSPDMQIKLMLRPDPEFPALGPVRSQGEERQEALPLFSALIRHKTASGFAGIWFDFSYIGRTGRKHD